MNQNNLDFNQNEAKIEPDKKLLLGALYATTLFYLYQNIYPINALLVNRFFGRGILSFSLRNLIPILVVILIGLLFKRMMRKTSQKRMVKVYITWLSSLFIYFILYQFHFSKVLRELIITPFAFAGELDSQSRLLIKYVEPLFYPFTIVIVIYLVFIGSRKTQNKPI